MAKPRSVGLLEQKSKVPHCVTRLPITQLNPYLTCALCSGYLIDATTIVECLHSFCRACLLRYLETSDTCPICDTQINESQLHKSVRSDRTLQDLVYKLVPGLYKSELQRRKEFCVEHYKNASTDPSTSSESNSATVKINQVFDQSLVDLAAHVCSNDEIVSFSLEFIGAEWSDKKHGAKHGSNLWKNLNHYKRYFRCPAGVGVTQLKKLLAYKLDLPNYHHVEIWHRGGNDDGGDEKLKDDWTLKDIVFLYCWKRKSPLQLHFNVCKYEVEEEPMPKLFREAAQTPPRCSASEPPPKDDQEPGFSNSTHTVTSSTTETRLYCPTVSNSLPTTPNSQEFKNPILVSASSEISPLPISPISPSFLQPAKLRLKKSLSSVVQKLNSCNSIGDGTKSVGNQTTFPVGFQKFANGNIPVGHVRPTAVVRKSTTPPLAKKIKRENNVEKEKEKTNNFTFFNGSEPFLNPDASTSGNSPNKSESTSINRNESATNPAPVLNPERVLCT